MKKYYNISYVRLALLLLIIMLRQKATTAFLSAIVRPLDNLHRTFMDYIDNMDTDVNSQVCYMQGMLNDAFDYHSRRIRIRIAALDKDYYLLWKYGLNKPILLSKEGSANHKFYLLNRDYQIGRNNMDFEVVLPSGFALNENSYNQMVSMINKNKLASKKYRIVYE